MAGPANNRPIIKKSVKEVPYIVGSPLSSLAMSAYKNANNIAVIKLFFTIDNRR